MIKHRVLRNTLVNKLECEEITGGQEGYKYRFFVRDRCIATTLLPTEKGTGKQIGKSLLGQIARQLFITTPQLTSIIDCEHEREGYIEMLKQSPLLERALGNRTEFLSGL